MLEEIMEKSGHTLVLSSKYHAEVVRQGIECFLVKESSGTKTQSFWYDGVT